MTSELIPLTFDKIMQTRSYTVVVLGSQQKKFAIYTEPNVGQILQTYLTGKEHARPFTHDLIDLIFRGLDVKVKQVVINDVQDTIYFARVFLEQKINGITHIIEIDARPSDCITLALMNNAPVFCTKEMLEKTVPITT
jgi:bifunctional DNase/RNase